MKRLRRRHAWLSLIAASLWLPCHAQDAPLPALPADPAVVEDPAGVEQPAPAPVEEQTQPGLIVRDLVVLQADRYGEAYNDPDDFTSTLFNRSPRRREISPQPNVTPMPLGIITLEGAAQTPTAIRIEIAGEDGRFLGHWPRGVAGEDYLVWHGIEPAQTPAGRMRIPEDHWLAPLRDEASRLCFNTRGHIDRFFAYDATFPFASTLGVEGNADDGYTLTGDALAEQTLAMIVRRTDAGWLVGTLDTPGSGGSVTMRPAADPDAAIAPILALLQEQGYSTTEADTAAAILRESAFGDASMSLLYVLGRAELDAMLPLSVNADDAEVRRVGIVVVNNVEPDIAGTVGGLIEQLGSDDWPTRDAAQRALIEMDRAAISLVRENAEHTDPEVAYRIEQVIAAYDQRHE